MASTARGSLRAFAHRDFAVLWSGAFVSNVGTWLQALVIPFVLFQITGSALWVGLAALAQFLPYFAFSPLGGWLADHVARRTVLRWTQALFAAAAAALWLIWLAGVRDPLTLLAFLAVGGALNGINLPSWQAFTSDLVPREDLHSAITLNSVQFNAARAIGPGLAGLVLAVLGATWAFGLNAVSFATVIVALLAVRTRGEPGRQKDRAGIVREFAAAARYTRAQPNLVVVIIVTMLVALLGNPVFAFTVVFAGEVYAVGPLALGMLNVAFGIGAILAVPLVTGWPRQVSLSRTVVGGLVTMGAMLVVFGAVPVYAVGVVSLVFVGGAFLAIISGVNTSLQLRVDPRYRGRVMALRMMVFTLGTAVGSFLQGVAAELFGAQLTMIGVGMILLAATALLALASGPRRLSALDASTGAAAWPETGDG